MEETFSDWRDVDGVRLPFQWSILQGGKKFAGATVQDYKINSGLTAETLGQKPANTKPQFAVPAGAKPPEPKP